MCHPLLSQRDLEELRERGLDPSVVMEHLRLFESPPPPVNILRPCTIGDGIHKVDPQDIQKFLQLHQEAALKGRFTKFVPASGAATRMFDLLHRFHSSATLSCREIKRKAAAGDAPCAQFVTFFENLERFAFFRDLDESLARDGMNLKELMAQGRSEIILDYLLTPRGLNYGHLPKGLLKFHRYGEEGRTAFEEHLIEAADYVRDSQGICRLHFTVSKEHLEQFRMHLEEVRERHQKALEVTFHVEFSIQSPSTDTIAVDLNNRPFRLMDGRILLRPGGHGALLQNLNDLGGDIVYIKNIDNVVPDWLKGPTFLWKKVLAGILIEVQDRLVEMMESMEASRPNRSLLNDAHEFARHKLGFRPPEWWSSLSEGQKCQYLLDFFNRPLRVCGMVPNQGEPGGGPFWVLDEDGSQSLQIVEAAQVDLSSPQQARVWQSATHFNPVDLVCSLRDHRGRPFDLRKFVDPNAVIITRKSQEGRELKALELPGLWNGAMARWNTIFIEVPLETFNPVKTVLDLLREAHQPPGS
jgi:hypothetical protein